MQINFLSWEVASSEIRNNQVLEEVLQCPGNDGLSVDPDSFYRCNVQENLIALRHIAQEIA